MRKIIYTCLIAIATIAGAISCKKASTTDNGTPGNGNGFDRAGMLTNLSTNIIIPGYTLYQTATVNLDAAVTAFNAAPDLAKLVTLQNAFKAAYLQWQAVSAFEVGPAANILLRINTNTFPTNVTQISSNINSGTYNPALIANYSAKGFPALDYLLFGTGADNNAILLQYTTDSKAANRRTYLASLTTELKTNAATVLSGWTTYKATFIAAAGTDAGSSVGQLTNQFIYDYEILKNYEIGIPAGTQSMGAALPEKVQAYYAKISVQLATAHLQAIQNIYTCGTGLGFDDYLTTINAKYSDGCMLNDVIKAQFATTLVKLQALTDPLQTNIATNQATVVATYTELQKLTVFLKTDMTSALGVAINYGDNDGD